MKGVATWMLVMASVIMGLIILTAGGIIFMRYVESTERQMIVNNIADLYNEIALICVDEGVGAQRYYKIELPENVRAVYVAKAEYSEPPDKVSVMISNQESAVGNYFCYQMWDDNLPICRELLCNLNFTYIGTPSLKNDLASLVSRLVSKKPIYAYELHISKKDDYYLLVNSRPYIGE